MTADHGRQAAEKRVIPWSVVWGRRSSRVAVRRLPENSNVVLCQPSSYGLCELKIPEAGRFERSRDASLSLVASTWRFLNVARNDVLDFRDFEFASIPKE